ncbi:hypothetical protein ACA910_012237 [Epithemia clementina (nom. ined.)]
MVSSSELAKAASRFALLISIRLDLREGAEGSMVVGNEIGECSKTDYMAWAACGHPEFCFSEIRIMGQNEIPHLLPELCRMAGLPNWREKTAHCLRQLFLGLMHFHVHERRPCVLSKGRHSLEFLVRSNAE